MKKLAFFIFLGLVLILIAVLALISKNENSAMVARVESRVLALSYQDPVKIEKIHVVPGQRIAKGDILIEVSSPKIDLDIEQKKNEIGQLDLEIRAIESEFEGRISQVQNDLSFEIQEEENDLKLLTTEVRLNSSSGELISNLTGSANRVDSSAVLKIQHQEQLILNLTVQRTKEVQRLRELKRNKMKILSSKREILQKELEVILKTKEKFINRAEQAGTVGNVFVEFNELVPPFNKLLTLYEMRPTLIKAYVEESLVETLKVGQKVRARAANREIWTEGRIEEFGTRVTDYPTQITLGAETRYGQEVFIRIAQQHAFLDGEKVFVYPDLDK